MAWIETVVSDDTSESATLPILRLRSVASSRDQSLSVAYYTLSHTSIRRFVVFGKILSNPVLGVFGKFAIIIR